MNTRIAVAFGLSCLLCAGPAAYAQNSTSKPRTRTVCENVTVQDQPKDQHQIAGMAIGAVAGGVLGNQVGGGKGRTLATVAGAVGGGYAGKKIQENQQTKHTHVERRCRQVAY
ncbi:glycine zipper 2TM domain-containing protein [Dyella sp. 2RAB6]|uniref:glycine zipper 2TM domain-containing protein n=1 Tax=Dyella sp. 2RAB6 TaxID=3232992 RepID=UPI003F8DE745